MSYHLGVDVGTTYTAAAVARDGRVEAATLGTRAVSVPTVVCLADDRLLVGEPAARRAVTDPLRVAREFKRRVGDPTPLLVGGSPLSAELCMARVVEWVVAHVSATEGEPPAGLALTHPANWGAYKLDLLRQAVHHAGLEVDRFVPEPVAAATAYAASRSLARGSVVAVYDLGGGTFDAALVQAGDAGGPARIVGRPDGIERLGGVDFDHAVFRHVLTAIDLDLDGIDAEDPRAAAGLAQLREDCIEAKEALSHETDVAIPVMLPQRHTEVRLTRREFESMIGPAVDETIVALQRTVASAGLRAEDIAAVLLVGGSSRIPLVGQRVAAELGRPVAVDARPKDTISLGAARLVAAESGRAPAPARPTAPVPAPSAVPADGSPSEAPGTPADVTGPLPGGPAPHGRAPAADVTAPYLTGPAPGRPATGRRALAAALAALIVVAGAVGIVLLGDDGEPSQAAPPESIAPVDEPEDDPDDPPDTTPGTPVDAGSLGDLGALGGDVPTPEPLPGDDWSDEARAQFVDDCATGMAAQLGPLAGDPVALCGCVYDDVSTSSDFAAFNAEWSSDEFDPGSEVGQDLTSAIFACAST